MGCVDVKAQNCFFEVGERSVQGGQKKVRGHLNTSHVTTSHNTLDCLLFCLERERDCRCLIFVRWDRWDGRPDKTRPCILTISAMERSRCGVHHAHHRSLEIEMHAKVCVCACVLCLVYVALSVSVDSICLLFKRTNMTYVCKEPKVDRFVYVIGVESSSESRC